MGISELPYKKQYIEAWKRLRSMPTDAEVVAFNWWPQPVPEVRRQFSKALDKRINSRGGTPERRGRKDCADLVCAWRQDQNDLAAIHRRVRVYQFRTPEVQARFSDRLSRYDD